MAGTGIIKVLECQRPDREDLAAHASNTKVNVAAYTISGSILGLDLDRSTLTPRHYRLLADAGVLTDRAGKRCLVFCSGSVTDQLRCSAPAGPIERSCPTSPPMGGWRWR